MTYKDVAADMKLLLDDDGKMVGSLHRIRRPRSSSHPKGYFLWALQIGRVHVDSGSLSRMKAVAEDMLS
jgi:hypothetical protein